MPGKVITCDYPGCTNHIETDDDKLANKVVELAKERGWQVADRFDPNGKDLCPQHKAGIQLEEFHGD